MLFRVRLGKHLEPIIAPICRANVASGVHLGPEIYEFLEATEQSKCVENYFPANNIRLGWRLVPYVLSLFLIVDPESKYSQAREHLASSPVGLREGATDESRRCGERRERKPTESLNEAIKRADLRQHGSLAR